MSFGGESASQTLDNLNEDGDNDDDETLDRIDDTVDQDAAGE